MTNYLIDFLVATGVGLAFLVLGWSSTRSIFLGKPLPLHMKTTLVYGFFFVLGMAYIMMVVSWLDGPPRWIFALVPAWGALIAYIAWRRHWRTKAPSPAPRRPLAALLAEAVPVVGLLVFLIASLIAWSVWAEAGVHLWVPLLCTAGATALIFLVRGDRRATVVVALRGLLVLGAIGAVARGSSTGFLAVGGIALALFLVEKLWRPGARKDEHDTAGSLLLKP